jgi:phytoene synthase
LRLARQHYENFPVASLLLPRATRHHVAAIYAFARIADDFADEGDRPDAERLALLEDWRRRLFACQRGGGAGDGSEAAHVFTALAHTINACRLEIELFDDLLSAFAQDVRVRRYASWPDLLDYCRRSANPIGRLVLRVHGHRAASMDAESDAICTALQLTNFWQDLGRDWTKGRVYVPRDVLAASGADEADLGRGQLSAAWQVALREVVGRTRRLFEQGRPLPDAVSGRLRWQLRATWLGGSRILDRVEALGPAVLSSRPSLDWTDAPGLAWRTAFW